MRNDFAVFICTHGRPTAQHTLAKLLSAGYTGKYYLVLDDQDPTIQQYIDTYGTEHLIVFDKNHYINSVDVGSNNPPFKCILYAKNAVEDMAKDMMLSAFVIADDDITSLRYRVCEDNSLKSYEISCNMDSVLDAYIEVLLSGNMAATSFGFAQFYFYGADSFNPQQYQRFRIPYNFVFRNTSISVDWKSAFGEDIVTAVHFGKLGQLWTALPDVEMSIKPLGKEVGGMHDTYKAFSDVQLAMFDCMYLPTATKPYFYKGKCMASVCRDHAFPKLISSSFKKGSVITR